MYGLECWGDACMKYVLPIVTLQKKIVRLIYGLSSCTHCAPYASLAGILFVPDVSSLLLYKLAYKVFYNYCIPFVISSLFNRIHHVHSTRAASYNFFVPCSRLKAYHKSPVLRCIRLWNDASVDLKLSLSLNVYLRNVVYSLFANYV